MYRKQKILYIFSQVAKFVREKRVENLNERKKLSNKIFVHFSIFWHLISIHFMQWQLISLKISQEYFLKTINHQELISGLYSIDFYNNFNFGPPLSTSFSRFSKCTVKGCYLESTFWISSNLFKSANFCLKLEKKGLKMFLIHSSKNRKN